METGRELHFRRAMKSSFDQRSLQLFTVVALYAVTACADGERQNQERSPDYRPSYDYELVLPDKFKRREVHGIDSKVEEWRSPDVIVSKDLGLYISPPTCSLASERCSVFSGLRRMMARRAPRGASKSKGVGVESMPRT